MTPGQEPRFESAGVGRSMRSGTLVASEIGQGLSDFYASVAVEPLPGRIVQLLRSIEAQDGASSTREPTSR